mmetsp:Transcript_21502/g.35492  ORF Transcript_21502/g.35492 Transcript_21502/m.35492 type:complete len:132 (+) Transcript_21502:748-1143(+)
MALTINNIAEFVTKERLALMPSSPGSYSRLMASAIRMFTIDIVILPEQLDFFVGRLIHKDDTQRCVRGYEAACDHSEQGNSQTSEADHHFVSWCCLSGGLADNERAGANLSRPMGPITYLDYALHFAEAVQ